MSHAESKSTTGAEPTQNNPALMPNGKAAAAAPKLSDDDNVELADMLPTGPVNPEDDIMQLARLGDIQGIEKLYETGKFDATYADEEGITPLHVLHLSPIYMEQVTDLNVVGCYQQPICHVPISPESRG